MPRRRIVLTRGTRIGVDRGIMPGKRGLVQSRLRNFMPGGRGVWPRMHVLQLFGNQDVAGAVVVYLNALEAVLCSMVCKSFRRIIDTYTCNVFQANMGLTLWARNLRNTPVLALEQRQKYLLHEHTARKCQWHALAKNCSNERGSILRMHATFLVPLHFLRVSSCPASVRKLGQVVVEVNEWRLAHAPRRGAWAPGEGDDLNWLCRVSQRHDLHLQARRVAIVDKGVRALFTNAIVLVLKDVPVLEATTARVRCVSSMVFRCMFCHQRPVAHESLDAQSAEHRVLCTVCWRELFVPTEQLEARFKVGRGTGRCSRVLACAETHYSPVVDELRLFPSSSTRKHVACMLKQRVAHALGHGSREDFLRNNHRSGPASRRRQAKGYRFDERANSR